MRIKEIKNINGDVVGVSYVPELVTTVVNTPDGNSHFVAINESITFEGRVESFVTDKPFLVDLAGNIVKTVFEQAQPVPVANMTPSMFVQPGAAISSMGVDCILLDHNKKETE